MAEADTPLERLASVAVAEAAAEETHRRRALFFERYNEHDAAGAVLFQDALSGYDHAFAARCHLLLGAPDAAWAALDVASSATQLCSDCAEVAADVAQGLANAAGSGLPTRYLCTMVHAIVRYTHAALVEGSQISCATALDYCSSTVKLHGSRLWGPGGVALRFNGLLLEARMQGRALDTAAVVRLLAGALQRRPMDHSPMEEATLGHIAQELMSHTLATRPPSMWQSWLCAAFRVLVFVTTPHHTTVAAPLCTYFVHRLSGGAPLRSVERYYALRFARALGERGGADAPDADAFLDLLAADISASVDVVSAARAAQQQQRRPCKRRMPA